MYPRLLTVISVFLLVLPVYGENARPLRPITVSDFIEMRELRELQSSNGSPFTMVSPDGKHLLILVRRGNVQKNVVEYSLLLWHTSQLFLSIPPKSLLTMSSGSNHPAIDHVSWLPDNETLVFLGESAEHTEQVFTFNIRTRSLRQLTHHSTNIVAYSVASDLHKIAFVAENSNQKLFNDEARRKGFLVSTQSLAQIISDTDDDDGRDELFLQTNTGRVRRLTIPEPILPWSRDTLEISPDGKVIAVRTYVTTVSSGWADYRDVELRRLVAESGHLKEGQHSQLSMFLLVDCATGRVRKAIDAPLSGNNDSIVLWAPDSSSVAITDTYLPIAAEASPSREVRETQAFIAEVNVKHASVTPITAERLQAVRWDRGGNLILRQNSSAANWQGLITYRKFAGQWTRFAQDDQLGTFPMITIEQDMNTPPRLFVSDPRSGRKALLLDLNPQFRKLAFGRVERIQWTSKTGQARTGGLYYPVNYAAGKKYPLVIQTHGFRPNIFDIGPGYTAFAAQPLAGKGIMVLQVDLNSPRADPSREAENEMAAYESAIDYLDAKGIIDKQRVGLVGFSRTCLHVKFTLTHSRYHFAAASVTDGVDSGYFQYLAFANNKPGLIDQFEKLNGGNPLAAGEESWLLRSPGFNLRNVTAPIRIVALTNTYSVLGEWEWFSGLSRLARPVELICLQDATHILQRPSDRLVSQQGTVDWFSFWLNGEEDHDLSKTTQYTRWRKMLGDVEARSTTPTMSSVP